MYHDHLGTSPAASSWSRSRVLLGAAAAVFVLGLVVDFADRAPATSRRDEAAALLFPLAAPEAPVPGSPQATSGLFEKAAGDALGFDEFMGYLKEAAQDPAVAPAAKEFVKAFKENPELMRAHSRFQEDSVSARKPKALDFVAALRSEPAFRQLVGRFLGDPRSGAALASGRFPEFAELADAYQRARGATSRTDSPRASPGGRPPTFEEARRSTLDAATAPELKGLAFGALRSPSVDGSGSSGAPGAPADGAPGAAPGGAPAVRDGRLGGTLAAERDRSLGAPTTIKDVRDIKPPEKPADPLNRYPFLAKHFAPGELGTLADGIDRHGLWGACFALGWYARCLDACREAPTLGGQPTCAPLPGWQACMSAFGDAGRCISLCRAQPPCQVDASAWAGRCSTPAGQPAPEECSPGEPAPAGSEAARQPYRGKCVQDGFGTCCFSAAGILLLPPGVAYDRWPAGTAPCSGSGLPELGRCSEGNGTCCWRDDGGVLYTSIPDANVHPEPAVPPSCRQPAPPWKRDGLPFYCERRTAGAAALECCFRAADGAFVRARPTRGPAAPTRGPADVEACLRPEPVVPAGGEQP